MLYATAEDLLRCALACRREMTYYAGVWRRNRRENPALARAALGHATRFRKDAAWYFELARKRELCSASFALAGKDEG
jgi:hypothetical protein